MTADQDEQVAKALTQIAYSMEHLVRYASALCLKLGVRKVCQYVSNRFCVPYWAILHLETLRAKIRMRVLNRPRPGRRGFSFWF
jgi:hypothetical protein